MIAFSFNLSAFISCGIDLMPDFIVNSNALLNGAISCFL